MISYGGELRLFGYHRAVCLVAVCLVAVQCSAVLDMA